jgi:hypothetical protein
MFHLVLTALPGAAVVTYVASRGERSLPILLAVALAATGAVAMASFWVYYAWPAAGKGLSLLLPMSSALALWLVVKHRGGLDRAMWRPLITPAALWALGSAFVLFLGFDHGGLTSPLATSATRFSHPLPSDNGIPYFFSNWFYVNGHVGTSPVFSGGWLSSDRPPLQVGYALSQRPGEWGNLELHYEVVGVLLQQLWIVGMWALLLAGRVSRVTRFLTMLMLLVSGLVLVNGFFVWPKLLPAAMLLGAIALIATPVWDEVRRSRWGAALAAALLALALLGHGASTFLVLPLAGLLLLRGIPNWRWLAVGAAIAALLILPWAAYQSYGDPPGNRLTKWMLAGSPDIDRRGTVETIIDSYSEIGVGGAWENKVGNFETMTGGHQAREELEAAFSDGLDSSIRTIRIDSFFFLAPSLGLLLLAPFFMVFARLRKRYRPQEWRFSMSCLGLSVLGCVVWGLLLFGNEESRAFIHQGSLAIPMLAICGLVIGLRASFPRFAFGFVGVNALLSLAIYVPALEPPDGTSYSILTCFLAAVALFAFGWVAWQSDASRTVPKTQSNGSKSTAVPIEA